MTQPVILLDVDGTLVDGFGNYNQGLLHALQQAQTTYPELRIVLFTAYEWGNVFIQKAQRGLTRLAVCQTLAQYGVRIDAVVVSGSNQYETEPAAFGHYYETVFRPLEAQCLACPQQDSATLQQLLDQHPALSQQDAEYKRRNQRLRTIDTRAQGGNDNKEPMFRHVLQHYGKHAQFLLLDDSAAVQAAARHLREQEGYPIHNYLTTVQAYTAGLETEKSYFHLLAKTFSWSIEPVSASEPTASPLPKSKGIFWRLFAKQRRFPAAASAAAPPEMTPTLPPRGEKH